MSPMATWKEKGVVPDSDDEDGFDSQITAVLENCDNEQRPNELYDVDDSPALEGDGESHLEPGQGGGSSVTSVKDTNESTSGQPIPLVATEEAPQILVTPNPSLTASVSFHEPFRIAPQLREDEEEQSPHVQHGAPLSYPISGLPAADEVSTSYVQITSPASSRLSTPPRSQPELPPHIDSTRQTKATQSQDGHEEVEMLRQEGAGGMEVAPSQELPNVTRRFRQRNALQLHPYMVEQEKYKRTLQARGIAPMRIASSQEVSRRQSRHTASPNPESQAEDSEKVVSDDADTQMMDIDWAPPSSSPIGLDHTSENDHNLGDDAHGPNEEDEEDEFPDIDQLLRRPIKASKLHEQKRRVTTYSHKFKRPPALSRIQTQPVRQHDRSNSAHQHFAFDLLASPPATSSPFTSTSQLRAGTRSKEPSPSIIDDIFSSAGDLPTPATSAVKAPILIESDLESNDPFASDADQALSASSSDESIQIRKISRKTRGVLPASHLRLNQTKLPKSTNRVRRDSQSLSPVKETFRRGVALPRVYQNTADLPALNNSRFTFFSESEGSDGGGTVSVTGGRVSSVIGSMFDQSRLGGAEEDDRIDAMLPSNKRSTTGLHRPRKKRKSAFGVGLRTLSGASERQPKITEHLKQPGRHNPHGESIRRQKKSKSYTLPQSITTSRKKRPAAPHLSILDVVEDATIHDSAMPQFIRVAARAVRSRADQGRQSPSKKFLRLANREDTQDAQSMLQDWKGGKIRQRKLGRQAGTPRENSRPPLQQIQNNQQTTFSTPLCARQANEKRDDGSSRQLVISRRQHSMSNFVTKESAPRNLRLPNPRHKVGRASGPRTQFRQVQQPARPAQLEATEGARSYPHSSTSLGTTKRLLDYLYGNTRRRPALASNLQLTRFLADEDIVRPSIESQSRVDNADALDDDVPDTSPVLSLRAAPRRKKRLPQRVDANAATYRQPSDPLILDFFSPGEPAAAGNDCNKLLGLGKFGTKYPHHFNISPLQPGIFFHASTTIGSGRLAEFIRGNYPKSSAVDQTPAALSFAGKKFSWEIWDEQVSSEVGVCFDWLFDQLQGPDASSLPVADAAEVSRFVLSYVQRHVKLEGHLKQDNFMSRMIEVIRDLSSRLNMKLSNSNIYAKQRVDVLCDCTLLAFRLLSLARVSPESSSSIFDLEDLLKSIAGHCIDVLVLHGVDDLRKLYEDLQYLSFRERGIKSDQYAAQGWVILIKVFDAARIPRGTFWDIVNPRLLTNGAKDVMDAPSMEKMWYSMYTLLPLCEFDEFGVVIPGLRHEAKFDNWSMPQQLLKQVFALYKLNQRQSPGFNDYCRSLFQRCHYLMVEWGWWKCSSIIGSLFDFFASHNLAHLRNEEVYASPHFLEELDAEPVLIPEPEDRCFHILLKIVALGIKHLSSAHDEKSIRNLVARLLPNHDRQYPKDEVIHQRDLAALRNHHDLLCTLFWASTASQRPSVSLIQELVIADRSHNEACLINIRAWEYLARFIVTKSMEVESYKPFSSWQQSFFTSLCSQYHDADDEVRQQADVLQKGSGEATLESMITETVLANKRSMIIPMCRSIAAMGSIVKAAKSSEMAQCALNCDVILKALDPALHTDPDLSDRLMNGCLTVVSNYLDQINAFHAVVLPGVTVAANENESQDSIDMAFNWGRMEMIIPLRQHIMDRLFPLIRQRLEAQSEKASANSLTDRIVDCWARLVAIVTGEGTMSLDAFLTRGQYAVFESKETHKIACEHWPSFLAHLLKHGKNLEDFKITGFDIGLEWLLALSRCQSVSVVENLTLELQRTEHYLCNGLDVRNPDPLRLIRTAIRIMGSILADKSTTTEAGLPPKQTQRLFSDMLGEVMKSMQQILESLEPGSDAHSHHLQVARVVVSDIKSYAGDFRPLIDFFIHPSSSYWPHDGDPNLYGAGIISYCIKLAQQPEKTSYELFYYLHSGWKNALISDRMDNYIACIKQGMRWWEFTKFMLSDFIPAVLSVGFSSSGWLLSSSFLPAITSRITRQLAIPDVNSALAFELLLNIFKIIMNGTITQARLFTHTLSGAHPLHRGILSVVFNFWFTIALPMRGYAVQHDQEAALEEVTDPLSSFIYHALHAFESGEKDMQHPEGQLDVRRGKYVEHFAKSMSKEIKETWEFEDEEGFAVVVKGRGTERSSVVRGRETLGEVLGAGVAVYEAAYENKDAVEVVGEENVYVRGLYV